MATITITIPTGVTNRVINAISTKYGYQSLLPDGITPNPQTKQDFVKAWIISMIKSAVKEQEGNNAAIAAINSNSSDIDTNISIT